MRETMIASLVGAFFVVTTAVFATDRLVPGQYPTIQAAIDAAVDGDTVVVEPNTYYENIDFGGKSLTLTSTDPNAPNVVAGTIIDANGSGTVVTFPDTGSAICLLAGFTITGGNTLDEGGGICCWNGTTTVNNCIITGNSAGDGGGVFSDYGELTVAGCAFIGNVADDDGGGIYKYDDNLMLTDCTFSENVAAHSGGGIRSIYGELTLTDCTFSSNSAAVEGGGVAIDYNSVTLTNCTFSGNSAHVGGGMNNSHWGATAINCIFSGNSADRGGGIATHKPYLGGLTLTNCTFSGNVANNNGGAVCNQLEGNLTLTNCVAWGNSANEGPQIALVSGGTVSISYSCLQGGQLDIYNGGTVNWLTGNIEDDPCFVDADGSDTVVGTEDDNLRLMSGSPCIDDGNNIAVPTDIADLDNDGNTTERTPLDLDGFGRFIDDLCTVDTGNGTPPIVDMGAYEFLRSDINSNGSVDFEDYCVIAERWPETSCGLCGGADLTCDGNVDWNDVRELVAHWLAGLSIDY